MSYKPFAELSEQLKEKTKLKGNDIMSNSNIEEAIDLTFARTQILGRIIHDPTLNYTTAGNAILSVSLATDEMNRGNDTWWSVVITRNAEEWMQRLKKGDRIYVEGTPQQRKWISNETKQPVTKHEIKAFVIRTGRKFNIEQEV